MLQHYVFIRYQENTPEEHVAAFCTKMHALSGVIPEIRQLEIGRDILHDARSWDLVLIMQFDSVEALRHYQKHVEHQAVMAFNQPRVSDVGSVDFLTAP